jgi:hypothetical protein
MSAASQTRVQFAAWRAAAISPSVLGRAPDGVATGGPAVSHAKNRRLLRRTRHANAEITTMDQRNVRDTKKRIYADRRAATDCSAKAIAVLDGALGLPTRFA